MIGGGGSGLPHDNMQPYVVLNWCIALEGVFVAIGCGSGGFMMGQQNLVLEFDQWGDDTVGEAFSGNAFTGTEFADPNGQPDVAGLAVGTAAPPCVPVAVDRRAHQLCRQLDADGRRAVAAAGGPLPRATRRSRARGRWR